MSVDQVQDWLQERNDNPVMLQQESPLRLFKTMGSHRRFTAALKNDPSKRFYKDDEDMVGLATSITEMLEPYDGKALRQWKELTGLGKFFPEKGLSLLNVKKMLKALQLPFHDDREAETSVRYVVIDWEKVEEYRLDFVTDSIELL